MPGWAPKWGPNRLTRICAPGQSQRSISAAEAGAWRTDAGSLPEASGSDDGYTNAGLCFNRSSRSAQQWGRRNPVQIAAKVVKNRSTGFAEADLGNHSHTTRFKP